MQGVVVRTCVQGIIGSNRLNDYFRHEVDNVVRSSCCLIFNIEAGEAAFLFGIVRFESPGRILIGFTIYAVYDHFPDGQRTLIYQEGSVYCFESVVQRRYFVCIVYLGDIQAVIFLIRFLTLQVYFGLFGSLASFIIEVSGKRSHFETSVAFGCCGDVIQRLYCFRESIGRSYCSRFLCSLLQPEEAVRIRFTIDFLHYFHWLSIYGNFRIGVEYGDCDRIFLHFVFTGSDCLDVVIR